MTGWSGVLGWFEPAHSLLPLSHLCSILSGSAWFLHEGFDDWLVLATFFFPFFLFLFGPRLEELHDDILPVICVDFRRLAGWLAGEGVVTAASN